jgi:ABC-type multidrug transport system fused ATPase/permease subunit
VTATATVRQYDSTTVPTVRQYDSTDSTTLLGLDRIVALVDVPAPARPSPHPPEKKKKIEIDDHKIVEAESRARGSVAWSVYGTYIRTVGPWLSVVVLLLLLAGQGATTFTEAWLALWANQNPTQQRDDVNMLVFGCATGGVVVISLGRALLFFRAALYAASRLHGTALGGTLRASLAFFHANPAGRIINRFSKDLGIVDEAMPSVGWDCLTCSLQLLAIVAVVASGLPWALLVTLPLGYLFYIFQRTYLRASREIKRLESTTRSPVFSSFQASIKGLALIRSYSQQHAFQHHFGHLLDENSSWWFCFLGTNRWLGFRLDFLSGCVVGSMVILAMGLRNLIDPPLVALALSYVLQLSGLLQWTVRQAAELENLMTSCERLVDFATLPRDGRGFSDDAQV